jgi:excisionase family DNA binding protein
MFALTKSTSETVAELLDVASVAELCGCSSRTVRRLSDAGKMPRPVKLGSLVRWRRSELQAWIDAGCPSGDRSPSRQASGR